MVPVGEGMGETKGEVRGRSARKGRAGLRIIGGGMSSIREVKASLIWVEGKRIMHLKRKKCKTVNTHSFLHHLIINEVTLLN